MKKYEKFVQLIATILFVSIGIYVFLSSFSHRNSTSSQVENLATSHEDPTIAESGDDAEHVSTQDTIEIAGERFQLATPTRISAVSKHKPDTTTPLRFIFDELQQEAVKGDPDATLELAGALVECTLAAADSAGLESQLLYLYQTRRVDGYAGQVEDLDSEAGEIRDRYTFCEGVSRDMVKEHFKYLRVAAENGSIEAKVRQNSYGSMLESEVFEALDIAWESEHERRVVTNQFLYDAAQEGEASAILRIGRSMENGGDLLAAEEARVYRIVAYHLYLRQGLHAERNGPRLQQELGAIRPSDRAAVIDSVNSMLQRDNCCYFIR